MYILRYFKNDDTMYVEKNIDSLKDSERIETELIFSNLESLNKQLINIEKKAKQIILIKKILELLNSRNPTKLVINDNNEKKIKELNLLTSKLFFYIYNAEEESELNKAIKVDYKIFNSSAYFIVPETYIWTFKSNASAHKIVKRKFHTVILKKRAHYAEIVSHNDLIHFNAEQKKAKKEELRQEREQLYCTSWRYIIMSP